MSSIHFPHASTTANECVSIFMNAQSQDEKIHEEGVEERKEIEAHND